MLTSDIRVNRQARPGRLNNRESHLVEGRSPSILGALEAPYRAPFVFADILRRAQSEAFGALGFRPKECPYQIVTSGGFWRLRDYAAQAASPPLLIVAAPIKRPYIWDIAQSVSAIGRCLQ